MIVDNIANLSRYNLPHRDAMMKFIAATDLKNMTGSEYEIQGRDLFVRVMNYVPKPAAENKFEAHRIYADLQLVVTGVELMQTAPKDVLTPLTDYDPQKEYQFFSAKEDINDLVIRANEFAVFFPGEAHRPSCLYRDQKVMVKKLVFKIRL